MSVTTMLWSPGRRCRGGAGFATGGVKDAGAQSKCVSGQRGASGFGVSAQEKGWALFPVEAASPSPRSRCCGCRFRLCSRSFPVVGVAERLAGSTERKALLGVEGMASAKVALGGSHRSGQLTGCRLLGTSRKDYESNLHKSRSSSSRPQNLDPKMLDGSLCS
jgi:hypothetical protein